MAKGDWWRREYDQKNNTESFEERLKKAQETLHKKKVYTAADWKQTKPQLTSQEKFQMVMKLIGETITPIERKWFQVYTKDDENNDWTFGFAIDNEIVYHFPLHSINGKSATVARAWLRNRKEKHPVEVIVICDQLVQLIKS